MLKKLVSFLLFLSLLGCGKTPSSPPSSKPLIFVSIAPYRFLAEQIAGSELDVQAIVPSGSNPHSFEPTSNQVSTVLRGQVWFRIGEPFEDKILPLLQIRNPDLKVHDLRSGISLIEEGHELSCCHCGMDHYD